MDALIIDTQKMIAQLSGEEGRRRFAYRDSLGFLTIGVGRLIDARRGGGLRDSEIDVMLTNDIAEALALIMHEPWFLACDTEPRRRAMVDMRFQLGDHQKGFIVTLEAITQQNWAKAARCIRKSLWYKQTPKRAERVAGALETG